LREFVGVSEAFVVAVFVSVNKIVTLRGESAKLCDVGHCVSSVLDF